jgi:cell division protein FtsW
MILVQASINLFAVLGLAPLTGVTLPFVSYGNSSLIITLAAVGLLLNIANGGSARMAARSGSKGRRPLRVVDGGRSKAAPAASRGASRAARSDRSRRYSGTRGSSAGRRRRAR